LGIEIDLYGIVPIAYGIPTVTQVGVETDHIFRFSYFLAFLCVDAVTEFQVVVPFEIPELIVSGKPEKAQCADGIITTGIPVYKGHFTHI
jgi:hypothetical protein